MSQGVYNVSWDLLAVEADSPEEALEVAVATFRTRLDAAPLFLVTDDETGDEYEIDYTGKG